MRGFRHSSRTRSRASRATRPLVLASVTAITLAGVGASSAQALQPAPTNFAIGGTATLKTLVKGSVPITGGFDADISPSTGSLSADLKLNRSSVKLVALDFLPVSAKVDFESVGKTTGTLVGGILKTNSKVRVKLPYVSVFGLQLAGSTTCQTKTVSNIALTSAAEFNPLIGGSLTGTFAISDLTGCGFLTGIISPLVAGKGNVLAVRLTPMPPRPTEPVYDTTPPSKPTIVKSDVTSTQVDLGWTASTDNVGVVAYEVSRPGASLVTTTSTSAIIGGLTPGTEYTFKVTAKDFMDNRTPSDAITVRTLGTAPGETTDPLTVTVAGKCRWPLVGLQPIKLDLTYSAPTRFRPGVDTPPFKLSGVVTAAGKTSSLFDLTTTDQLTGTGKVGLEYALPAGQNLAFKVPVAIDPASAVLAPAPLQFSFSGETPPLTFDELGNAVLKLSSFALNLKLRSPTTGEGVQFPPLPTDAAGIPVTPSDSDPTTFDVYCSFDAGQNLVLGTIYIIADAPNNTTP